MAIHEVCHKTVGHKVNALRLYRSYLTVVLCSVQYGRLFHPGHTTINNKSAPHWSTITQTEHKGWVTIYTCHLVNGAMATMFLISKAWYGQLIVPGTNIPVHVFAAARWLAD